MDLGLKNKVAVVAAASQGLGKAVALELAREGARVALCSRSTDRAEAAAEDIRQQTGAEVIAVEADVSKEDAVNHFVAAAAEKWGTVHICVTNTGGPPAKDFESLTIEDWRAAIDNTFMSAVYLARAALPYMKKQRWGRLLFITSTTAKQPLHDLMLSSALRAGLTGLAKGLANEYGPHNVLVNTVIPGHTRTERLQELEDVLSAKRGVPGSEIVAGWTAEVPTGRLGEPEEFAAAVAFLASERASFITGSSLAVDGGRIKNVF